MIKTFVILGNARWDSGGIGGNSSQKYALTLMRMGYDVAYVEPGGKWQFKKFEDITDPGSTIVMCDFPYFEHITTIFNALVDRGCFSVCRIVDLWQSWENTDVIQSEKFIPDLEREVVQKADLVYALNPLNVERLKPIRPDIKLLRNGVDLDHFREFQVDDKIDVPKGRITFAVAASFWIPSWIDLDPLLNYAKKYDDVVVNIMGDASAFISQDDCPANVFLHGAKHWSVLPNYLLSSDICYIPYRLTKTQYANPTKALEYLACGKPVITCTNPTLTDYPYMYFCNDHDDFEAAVMEASFEEIDLEKLHDFLEKRTWGENIKTILNDYAKYESAEECYKQGVQY